VRNERRYSSSRRGGTWQAPHSAGAPLRRKRQRSDGRAVMTHRHPTLQGFVLARRAPPASVARLPCVSLQGLGFASLPLCGAAPRPFLWRPVVASSARHTVKDDVAKRGSRVQQCGTHSFSAAPFCAALGARNPRRQPANTPHKQRPAAKEQRTKQLNLAAGLHDNLTATHAGSIATSERSSC
jgi:hypothetical protein